MKSKFVTIACVLLGTSLSYAQEDLSVTERAELLTEIVNTGGVIEAVATSDMSETEIRMLDLILGLGLPESDDARELLEDQIGGTLPEIHPDFTITHSKSLMREANEMWGSAMQMIKRQRMATRPQPTPAPLPDVQIPIKTQPMALPLTVPFAIPSIVKVRPSNTANNIANIRYSVWVENQTDIIVDEMIVFYLQKGSNVMQMRQVIPVLPGGIAMFELGQCTMMESYSLGIFIGDDLVARIPQPGQNMTPELASQYHAWDTDPCKDTWGFGR